MTPLQVGTGAVLATIGTDIELVLRAARQAPAAQRRQLEAFIARTFAAHYGARLRQFMPCLLGGYAADGQLQAAIGVRPAESGALFLERYLDEPLEQHIAALSGAGLVPRGQIVEVGNLATLGAGQARLLIVAITELLASAGFRWVAFTGTHLLLNSFRRLGVGLLNLGPADGQRLGAALADWGSYYATEPQVMVGDLQATDQALRAAGVYQRLGYRPSHGQGGEVAHVVCG